MTGEIGQFRILHPLEPFLGHGPRDVRAYRVTYRSDDLTITAWLYEPSEYPMDEPRHPIDRPAPEGGAILAGHGGVWGIPEYYDHVMRRLAKAGWTVVAPSYRGEDGSDGEIEFALGEKYDTVACLKALAGIPWVNPERTWLLGSSHGAMVNLLMLACCRELDDVNPRGAVAVSGPYDIPAWFDWLREENPSLLDDPILVWLIGLSTDELQARSVIYKAEKIDPPVLLIHGGADTMVPVELTESLGRAFVGAGKSNFRIRIQPGSDHEFIWAPDRGDAVETWHEIIEFMDQGVT